MDIATKQEPANQETQLIVTKDVKGEAIANLPYFVLLANKNGKVLYANQAACYVFEYDRSNIPQIDLATIFSRIHGDSQFKAMQYALDTNGRWEGDCQLIRQDGTEIALELIALRIDSDTSSEPTFLYSGHNVTAQRCDQRKACQFEKLSTRGEMAGEVSHEINNYLSIIMGNLELLGMGIAKGNIDALGPRIKSMREGLSRLTKFIEGLMSIARPDATYEQVNLKEVIENEVFFLRHDLSFNGIEFIYEWDNAIPEISVVRGRLQQALYNIFCNARDALAAVPGGQKRITITASNLDDGGFVRLNISDNGCGMSAEDYQKLYRQLFTTKGPGHGFGLLAVKGAIKSQGGKVSASPAPDGGACFTIELQNAPKTKVS